MRSHNRKIDELRPIEFIRNYTKHAEGSVLVKFGDTHVLCNASIENGVPGVNVNAWCLVNRWSQHAFVAW